MSWCPEAPDVVIQIAPMAGGRAPGDQLAEQALDALSEAPLTEAECRAIAVNVPPGLALVVPDGIHKDLIERGGVERTRAVAGHR